MVTFDSPKYLASSNSPLVVAPLLGMREGPSRGFGGMAKSHDLSSYPRRALNMNMKNTFGVVNDMVLTQV